MGTTLEIGNMGGKTLEIGGRSVEDVVRGAHSYGTITAPWGASIRIGKYCSIAGEVKAIVQTDHRPDFVSTFPFRHRWKMPNVADTSKSQNPEIIIENDVWIGTGAMLLGGCHIKDGAIVGCYAVVGGVVPPYSVVVGNPARVIRMRFPGWQVAELLQIRWWDWPDEKVRLYVDLLSNSDVQNFIYQAKGGTTWAE
jgi:acetyltransferase-like isoleucine patch superfamily enzyme